MGDLQDVEALRPFPLYAPTRGRIAGTQQRTRDLVLMDEPQPLLAEIGETRHYGEYPGLNLTQHCARNKACVACRHGPMGCFF